MEEIFKDIKHIPAIQKRVEYLTKYMEDAKTGSNRDFTRAVLLFSLFIEHVSLFSQFLIMMSFNKERNLFSGVSNVVESTSKEEEIHGNFGAELINIILTENPEWKTVEFENQIKADCVQAYNAECEILNWIFEEGELDFLPISTIQEFLKGRFNNSLARIDIEPFFDTDEDILETTDWFELELKTTKEGDFFYKKSIDYNKKSKPITADDLF